ncbi:helix-turn-helix domain-containing protein [Embleya sp. NPDC059259]|uniref:helix-turn-helix domain-containing protein n=1 Tax=unclassified Embleya TaxID=2699296 RepID=UPI003696ABD2
MPDQGIGGAGVPARAVQARTVTFKRRGITHTTQKLTIGLDEAAAALGVSYMTLYRAVREDEFPGIKVRGRILVPVRALDLLLDAALQSGELVDAAAWTAAWIAVPSAPASSDEGAA